MTSDVHCQVVALFIGLIYCSFSALTYSLYLEHLLSIIPTHWHGPNFCMYCSDPRSRACFVIIHIALCILSHSLSNALNSIYSSSVYFKFVYPCHHAAMFVHGHSFAVLCFSVCCVFCRSNKFCCHPTERSATLRRFGSPFR